MTRNAWHAPENGNRTHYHGARGFPVCGAGWYGGRSVAVIPRNACRRCLKILSNINSDTYHTPRAVLASLREQSERDSVSSGMDNGTTVKVMSDGLLAVIKRNADAGDHNSKVLLRLARTTGIPQGSQRMVTADSPLAGRK